MTRAIDGWVSDWAPRLAGLPRDFFALFFAYAAERLIPLYVAFEEKHGWGDSVGLRRQLDLVWNALAGLPIVSPRDALEHLEAMSPSGEKFDSPDSTYAQDAVVCVDAATKALISNDTLDGNWLEYAIEPVKTRVSIEQSGNSSMEGDAAEELEARLMADPRVAAFLRDCEGLISRLEASARLPTANEIRTQARLKPLCADEYLTP